MKKFENPIINVSLFEVENIVTASGDNPSKTVAIDKAQKTLKDRGITDVLVF